MGPRARSEHSLSARRRAERRRPVRMMGSGSVRPAFTLIELLVVIAIIAILAAILFPVFAQAREQARMSTCLSNFKQIGLGVMMYVQDWDETYPMNRIAVNPGGHECDGTGKMISWKHETQPYVKNVGVFKCPSNPQNSKPDETGGGDKFGYT